MPNGPMVYIQVMCGGKVLCMAHCKSFIVKIGQTYYTTSFGILLVGCLGQNRKNCFCKNRGKNNNPAQPNNQSITGNAVALAENI